MKATLKILLYVGLSIIGLVAVPILAFSAWLRWEYRLPSEQTARQEFASHRTDYVRFVSMLRRDPGTKIIDGNGKAVDYAGHARYIPQYYELMRTVSAKSVMIRQDGSIEFQVWGFGCAPCTDSLMGVRYFPRGAQEPAKAEWTPKIVNSLDNASLPKANGAVADGLYVVPLDAEWSIYRLQISD
jgi:hypothetical protein